MTQIIELITGPMWPVFAAVLALIGFKGFGMMKKREGAHEAENAMREADSDRAKEIEDDADETRRRIDGMSDDDVDDWLRDHPSRRDQRN